MDDPNGDERRIERLDAIVESLSSHPDEAVREAVGDLIAGLRWLHAEGIGRLVDLLAEDPERFRRALDDPRIGNLLLLYDLVTVDERARAEEALEEMRPYLRSHGGEAELLHVDDGVVHLRLLGACEGCPSSSATLRQGIVRALEERLPGFRRLEVVDGEEGRDGGNGRLPGLAGDERRGDRERRGEPVSFVPEETLLSLESRLEEAREEVADEDRKRRARIARMGPLEELPPGAMHGALADNYPILVVRLGDDVHAWQNTCPGSILPLHLGTLAGRTLTCPWHGCRFDAATGERLEGEGAALHRLPVETVDDEVRVEL